MSIVIPSNFENSTVELDTVSMKAVPHLGQEKFVHRVDYKITTTAGEHSISDVLQVFFPPETTTELSDNFTNYENLNKNQVLDWVREYAPLLEIRYSQCNRILEATAPLEEEIALPW